MDRPPWTLYPGATEPPRRRGPGARANPLSRAEEPPVWTVHRGRSIQERLNFLGSILNSKYGLHNLSLTLRPPYAYLTPTLRLQSDYLTPTLRRAYAYTTPTLRLPYAYLTPTLRAPYA